MDNTQKNSIFDKLSLIVTSVTFFLLPIFFLPYSGLSVDYSKTTLLLFGVMLATLFWLVARLKSGEIQIPRGWIMFSLVGLAVVTFLASVFSPSIRYSLFGLGYEMDTFLVILSVILLAFLSANFFKTNNRIFYLYLSILITSLVFCIFYAVRILGGSHLFSFGTFFQQTSGLIGKWNDLAIFSGVSGLISVMALEFLKPKGILKFFLYISTVVSLLFLIVVDFTMVWWVFGILSVVIFVYSFSFGNFSPKSEDDRKRIPILPLVILVLSILFLLPGGLVSDFVTSKFNRVNIEARPSLSATWDITKNTLKKDPLLGSGPNQFSNDWALHKSPAVNSSVFWNTDFNFGLGLILTSFATTGVLGILAWLALLALFVFLGAKMVLSPKEDKVLNYLTFSSYLIALYLWVFALFYVPGITLFSFAFLFTGVLVALSVRGGWNKKFEINFLRDPRVGFISVLVLILLIIALAIGLFLSVQRFSAMLYYQSGLKEINMSGDYEKASLKISKAIKLYESDIYYAGMSEVYTLGIANLLQKENVSEDILKSTFQSLLGLAINSAQQATKINEADYKNWVSLGRVYEAVVPLNIEGSYENAKSSYTKAMELNPYNPSIDLMFARLEISRKNIEQARVHIADALNKKGNYVDAIYLDSQISVDEGNISKAISSLETASLMDPNNTGVLFQLGFLRYRNKDYEGAVTAMERAVITNQFFANAKYFLGLSYEKVGRHSDAVAQFEDLKLLNPDNEEIEKILSNLKLGKSPFIQVVPPLEKPEDRDEPPIEE